MINQPLLVDMLTAKNIDLEEAISEVSVRELLFIIKEQTKPIETWIAKIEDDMKLISVVEKHVELLEKEMSHKQENIGTF